MGHPFGLVIYRFGKDDGTLIAEWVNDEENHPESEVGIGIARSREPHKPGFPGEYDVKYWIEGREIQLILQIVEAGPILNMSWLENGKVLHTGYGFISGDMLLAGYSR